VNDTEKGRQPGGGGGSVEAATEICFQLRGHTFGGPWAVNLGVNR